MASTASVRIVKTFNYRGVATEFSNRYHIGTNYPPDNSHWGQLLNTVADYEANLWPNHALGGARIVKAFGYKPGTDVPVIELDMNIDGRNLFDSWAPCPGDCAAIVRCATPDKSVKNHPIYLYSYYHAISSQAGADTNDTLHTQQHGAIQTYASAWITGFSDGSTMYRRSRPSGNLATSATAEPLISHRDLAR